MAASIRRKRFHAVDQRHRMRLLARWHQQGLAHVIDGWKLLVRQNRLIWRTCVRFQILGHPHLLTGITSSGKYEEEMDW